MPKVDKIALYPSLNEYAYSAHFVGLATPKNIQESRMSNGTMWIPYNHKQSLHITKIASTTHHVTSKDLLYFPIP